MGLFSRRPQISGLCRLNNCNNSERSSRRFITTNEAPYQMIGKRTLSATLGYKELSSGHFWISILSECLSCYLYVFIVCSTRISWTGAIIGHEPNLLAMALSSGIAMMLLIFAFRTVHVNPALTISFLVTGRIPIVRAIIYVIVHCMSGVAAIAFLYSISIKGHAGALGLDNPHSILTWWQVLIVEFVISFVVTFATYATCNYSSYTNAKRLILDQLSSENSSLLSSPDCDNSTTFRHSRRSVVPVVPPMPSTSINWFESSRGDLLPGINNDTHVHNQQPHNNQMGNRNNFNTAKPYLVSNHYNQIYDDYNDVILNNHSSSSGGSNTNSNNLTRALVKPNESNGIHTNVTLPNFKANLPNKGSLLNTYHEDNSLDYEYDNHRIYATQQIKSESSSQVTIEERMQDECQLLAPNGFSFQMTSGQAFVIGLAYTLASLSGIPASGASLNPARSFGPAFIMNLWDNHWIYWVGPILGSVIAGFFYEFIFNPTRRSSLCYRPKLFRLSAHDMARIGSKSRSHQHYQHHIHQLNIPQQRHQNQHQQQSLHQATHSPSQSLIQQSNQNHQQRFQTQVPSSMNCRSQTLHQPVMHHSPVGRSTTANNLATNVGVHKTTSRHMPLITGSTSITHLQPTHPLVNNFEPVNVQRQWPH